MKVRLKVIAGPHVGREFNFDTHDTFIVGRAAHAHFRLTARDKYFSRSHFLVEVNPPRCRLMDLGSTNGTYVNRQRVTEVELHDGDVIVGGRTRIHVAIESAPEEVSTRWQTGGGAHRQTILVAEDADVTDPTSLRGGPTPQHPPPPAADAPAQVGIYRLIREIGRGGMGVVYLAQRQTDGREVAIKMIRPDGDIEPRDLQRFLREAEVLQSLHDPGIVEFLEMGESAGRLYFAMEYVSGENAWQLVQRAGPLPVALATAIVCQVLESLEYAHRRGYIHRDIKPENILLAGQDASHRAKLADFGLARLYEASRISGLTLRGEMGGSLAFAPPEQLTNYRDAQPTSDVYSAAATLYSLLSGEFVYDFPTALNLAVLMILQEDPVPIRRRCPGLPERLAATIHRALARDPVDRPASAAALREELLPFA